MAIAEDLDRATDSQWDWVAEHTRTYLASGGTTGHESNGVRTLVLATTGRRTGTPRRTCLIYGTSGGEYVVVASKGRCRAGPGMVHEPRRGSQRRGAGRHSPVHRTRPCRVLGRARAPLGIVLLTPLDGPVGAETPVASWGLPGSAVHGRQRHLR